MTHGGVIMSMLSQRAVPTRAPSSDGRPGLRLHCADRCAAVDAEQAGRGHRHRTLRYADTLQGQAEAEENENYE